MPAPEARLKKAGQIFAASTLATILRLSLLRRARTFSKAASLRRTCELLSADLIKNSTLAVLSGSSRNLAFKLVGGAMRTRLGSVVRRFL